MRSGFSCSNHAVKLLLNYVLKALHFFITLHIHENDITPPGSKASYYNKDY